MTTPEPLTPEELASAHLDGATTPAQAALVEADPALRARVAELAAVRDLVGDTGSVTAEAAASREPAVAAALAAFDALGEGDRDADAAPAVTGARPLATVAARRGRPEGRGRWLVAAAAAVAAVALAVPLVAQLGDDGSDGDGEQLALDDSATSLESGADSRAGSAAEESAPPASADPDAARDAAAAAGLGPVELGAFADLSALEEAMRARSDTMSYEGSGQTAHDDPAATTTTQPACLPPVEGARPPEGAVPRLAARATVASVPVLVDLYELPDGGRYLVVVDAGTCALVSARPVEPAGP